jgi:hypothetical protein
MDQSARFSGPLATSRPRGSRLIEAFSPKLGRRLRCFGRHAFDQWIRLEADPKTLTFCERPLTVDQGDDKHIVDFWVRSRDDEALLIIGDDCPMSQTMIGSTSLPIRSVPLAELAAARVWIANWARMLPCITACRSCLPDALLKVVADFVSAPMQLSHIERHFAPGDPTLVRAAVFTLLHRGRLQAPQLLTQPLSLLSSFGPAGEGQ